ncbi:MAG: EB domain-containing protein [Chitinophagales bacterium]
MFLRLITVILAVLLLNACKQCPNCQNGGTCANGVCICQKNYTGTLCEKDNCTGVNCPSGQTCSNGVCKCPDGYQGAVCDQLVTAQFADTFNVVETAAGKTRTYTAYITSNGPPSLLQLKLTPMYRGTTIYGTVTPYQSGITIFHQTPPNFDDVYGSGSMSSGNINLNITYDSAGTAPKVTVLYKMTRL